jgi:hypothetical protein
MSRLRRRAKWTVMASSPNEHLDEISLSIIRRGHEIDVSANDERASSGYLMLIRGQVSAGRETPAVQGAIWMVGDDSAFEPARRAGPR